MTRRFRLILSGSCAVLAALSCLLYGQSVREEADRARAEALERYGGEVVSLVVATEGIEAGETVDRSNVAERDWLADLAPSDAVTGIDSVLGTKVSVPVAAGVPLTALNFRDVEDAVEVPADRVALSLPVTGDLVLPPGLSAGAELAAYEAADEGVRLLADDLLVLATPQAGEGIYASGSLTVAVAPENVAPVLAASGEGSLRLALPGDEALSLDETAPAAPTEVPPEDAVAPDGDEGPDEAGGQGGWTEGDAAAPEAATSEDVPAADDEEGPDE